MNNVEKQEYLIELDYLINDLIKAHNKDENYIIIANEIETLVNSAIKNVKTNHCITYKERKNLLDEMTKKAINVLIHAGFEYK